MKIYFAGPLFCQAELEFNSKVAAELRAEGHEVFLPQENSDGVRVQMEIDGRRELMKRLFDTDIKAIEDADTLLLVMDGRVPDEGACFELGYAYARNKICVGLKTDVRVSEFGTDNAMLVGSLGNNIAEDIPSLVAMLKKVEPIS